MLLPMLSAVSLEHEKRETQAFLSFRFLLTLSGWALLVVGCSTTASFQNTLSLNPSTSMGGETSSGISTDSIFEFERQALKHMVLDFHGPHTLLGSQVLAAIERNPNLSVHDFLVEMLNDKNWVTRLQAASAIELVHDERGWEALQTLLRDPDIVVKLRVERILSTWMPSSTRHTAQTIEGEGIGGISMEKANAPRMIIERAEGFFLKENYSLAIGEFHHFLDLYPGHLLAPFAKFKLGESYFKTALSVDRDPTPIQNALAVYQAFLNDYPKSHYKSRLGARIRECQNWLARVDLLVGRFYFKKEKYVAAAHRFGKIVGNDLDLEVLPDALYNLAQAYMEIGQEKWPEARNVLTQLTKKYPNYKHSEKSKTLLASLNKSLSAHIFARAFPPTANDSFIHEVAQTVSFGHKGPLQQKGFHNNSVTSPSLIPSSGSSEKGDSQNAHNLRNNTQDCLAPSTNPFPVASLSLKTEFDCDLALPQMDSRVKFSYGKQNWYTSHVRNLNDFVKNLDRENNLARSTGNMNLLDKALQATFDLAYSYPSFQGPIEPDGKDGLATQIGLKGMHDRINYWGTYQYFGKEFTNNWNANPEDRQKAEETTVGAEFDLGIFKPMVQLKRSSNNVENDPTKSQTNSNDGNQTNSNDGNVSIALNVPQWPVLTLTYGREQKKTADKTRGTLKNDKSTEMVSANLWYGGSTWETYLTSSYSKIRDQVVDSGSDTVVNYSQLGGSFQGFDGLSINPSLEFMQTRDNPSNYRMEMLTASLGLYYSNLERALNISLYGFSNTLSDSDGYVDTRDIGVSLGVEKDLKEILGLPHSNQKIILKMDHYSYRDLIYSTSSSSVSSALLLFKITP